MAALSDKPKDLQRYILQAQQPVICNADALKAMPQDKKHWKRRGRMLVFCFDV
ncbi:MAG: hypothetical protein AAF821_15690 [Cyanobacteria bacterium P01_D01_bin.156]